MQNYFCFGGIGNICVIYTIFSFFEVISLKTQLAYITILQWNIGLKIEREEGKGENFGETLENDYVII